MVIAAWQPIVVGVDGTPAGAAAVRQAVALAERAGVTCRFVHAAPEVWSIAAVPSTFAGGPSAVNRAGAEASGRAVREALRGRVPDAALRRLEVRVGRPGRVLAEAAEQSGAGLIVVGGKPHSNLGRWLAGSTAHAVVRTSTVPVLIAAGVELPHSRVLCAVDVSDGAPSIVKAAARWSDLLETSLSVMHALQPLPAFADAALAISSAEHRIHTEEALVRLVWPAVPDGAERLVRDGQPEQLITDEVERGDVDLVVVGSHGRGWVDRMLLGSVTERLLGLLPTSMLVVPARPARIPERRRRRQDVQILSRQPPAAHS